MGAEESRYTISDLHQFYQRVEIGDSLEFPAQPRPQSHYGIYVGKYGDRRHCVIHFDTPHEDIEKMILGDVTRVATGANDRRQASAGPKKHARIQITEVKYLLRKYICVIINNSNDKSWVPRENSVIRDQAIQHYENRDYEEYNVCFNNCEHFVNDVRYGKARSLQVENVAIGGAAIAVAAIAAFGYALSQREDEERPRHRSREEEDEERPRHQRRR